MPPSHNYHNQSNESLAWVNFQSFDDLKDAENLLITDRLILHRRPDIQALYDTEIAKNASVQKPYAESVRFDVFHSNQRAENRIIFSDKIALVKNKFPANLPADTEHWNIWFDMPEVPQSLLYEVKSKILHAKNWSDDDIIIWEKQLHNRSVPEIRHWHIFARKVLDKNPKS